MTAKENLHPDVPEEIKAPVGEQLVFRAHASGSQIYICQQDKDGKCVWILKAPEAVLYDDHGNIIGNHFAGPSWRHNDGSEVTGKAVARVDAVNAGSIPWLLISAVGHSGRGIFTAVTTIQRIHTKDGQPPAPSECTAPRRNTEVKIGYTADYYFYAPAG